MAFCFYWLQSGLKMTSASSFLTRCLFSHPAWSCWLVGWGNEICQCWSVNRWGSERSKHSGVDFSDAVRRAVNAAQMVTLLPKSGFFDTERPVHFDSLHGTPFDTQSRSRWICCHLIYCELKTQNHHFLSFLAAFSSLVQYFTLLFFFFFCGKRSQASFPSSSDLVWVARSAWRSPWMAWWRGFRRAWRTSDRARTDRLNCGQCVCLRGWWVVGVTVSARRFSFFFIQTVASRTANLM